MDQQLCELRDLRTRQKAKVTSVVTKIANFVQRAKSIEDIDKLVESLDNEFSNFSGTHDLYSDLLSNDSESKYESYNVVNGLNLEQYARSVKATYDEAIDMVMNYEMKLKNEQFALLQRDSCDLLDQNKFLMSQLDELTSNRDIDKSVVFGEIDIFIRKLENNVNIMRKINVGDYSSFYTSVNACIVSLQHKVMQVKQLSHLSPSHQAGSAENNLLDSGNMDNIQSSSSAARSSNSHSLTSPASSNSLLITTESSDVLNASGTPISLSHSIPSSLNDTSNPVSNVAVSARNSMTLGVDSRSSEVSQSSSGAAVVHTTWSSGKQPVSSQLATIYDTPPSGKGASNMQAVSSTEPSYLGTGQNRQAGAVFTPSVIRSHNGVFNSTPRGQPGSLLNDSQNSLSLSITAAYANHPSRSVPVSSSVTRVGNTANDSGPANSRIRESRFKQAPLPTFDGDRKEWSEFRAVWLSYAHSECHTEEERAWNLKQCLKGRALTHVKAILVNQPLAHERMWKRLEDIYSDASITVRAAFSELEKLSPVMDNDIKGLIDFVNSVEMCYSQLGEVQQLASVTLAQVDALKDRLPIIVKRDWMRVYRSLSAEEKINPFTRFMIFLEEERDICIRENAEDSFWSQESPKEKLVKKISAKTHSSDNQPSTTDNDSPCLIHSMAKSKHSTTQCNQFKRMARKDRITLLIKHKACFKCAGSHMRQNCPDRSNCGTCGRDDHHILLCKVGQDDSQPSDKVNQVPQVSDQTTDQLKSEKTTNHARQDSSCSVFPIQKVMIAGTSVTATIFFDGGSNATYVSNEAAKQFKAKKVGSALLEITRVGNIVSEHRANRYKIRLMKTNGEAVSILAFGMEEITSPVSSMGINVLESLFPKRTDLSDLVRDGGRVDILLGNDYYGHHPKIEIDRAGPHLSLMEGVFGRCVQGSHPVLQQLPVVSSLIGSSCIEGSSMDQIPVQTSLARADMNTIEKFIQCEEMVADIQPRCGSCKCGKCPIQGHTYSFKEQQEVEMIRANLKYDQEKELWVTTYPWLIDPCVLPNNYQAVLATLRNTEKTLAKRGEEWMEKYSDQIKDMEDRGVARKLTAKELSDWKGAKFYISHLAVENPKSSSTPVRIVFNSSQKFDGKSLNDCLAKGPDNYMTNILGIIMRWREGAAVVIGDVKKMFNSICIEETEQHCHRFLWRDLNPNKEPDTYVITRVNMGDRPAPAISTEAILKTAELMKEKFPRVATLVQESMYVDDIVESVSSISEARLLAKEASTVLMKGGFHIKGWVFNNDASLEGENMRVLGIFWDPHTDAMQFQPLLNFSRKVRGQHSEPNLLPDQVPQAIPTKLTKRMVLEQVMRIYDPIGILSPFIVRGKMNLRETWELVSAWDDPLPDHMRAKWISFFKEMTELDGMKYDRCITPAGAQGMPMLVILCDASDKAYGFVAYIRWKLEDGNYFCRLILAKSRIAPIRKLSTPQLELNGAVLAKRGRETIEKEMRLQFEKVIYLTDSETVLCMLKKTSTRFKLYEGVRVGEIQSVSKDMNEWKWIRGDHNIADWVSRGRRPKDIGPSTSWWIGPEFLYHPEDKWETKPINEVGQKCETLPGEKKLTNTSHMAATSTKQLGLDYNRYGSAKKLIWVVSRLLAIVEAKSFKGGRTSNVSVKHIVSAKKLLIRDAQAIMNLEQEQKGRYKNLKPTIDDHGIWVIGERMEDYNPIKSGQEDPPLQLLPTYHPLTRLLMEEAHSSGGHRGRDATLARFRHSYWTPKGPRLAKSVKDSCRLCIIREPRLLSQQMGKLPLGRLQPTTPFTNVVLDLFGPFPVRGEVQKRTTGKAWGVIFTDMSSRAVHIEGVFGYDTSSFLLAFRRFTNLRGWPETIYSDPGTQLTHAEKELRKLWEAIDKESIYKTSTDKGLTWNFGPADASWYQGAAESLIKSVKRCFTFCMSGQRLTPAEFLTLCTEAANILNERPLGRIPSEDSTINLLTPNSLLLGRSLSNSVGDSGISVSIAKTRSEVVHQVCDRFWRRWVELFAPTMMQHTKWHKKMRNLEVGDIVLVCDSNVLRSHYHLAEVMQTYPDSNGMIRRVSLRYRNVKVGKNVRTYAGGSDVVISRSVHKLSLVVPIEEQ